MGKKIIEGDLQKIAYDSIDFLQKRKIKKQLLELQEKLKIAEKTTDEKEVKNILSEIQKLIST